MCGRYGLQEISKAKRDPARSVIENAFKVRRDFVWIDLVADTVKIGWQLIPEAFKKFQQIIRTVKFQMVVAAGVSEQSCEY